MYITVLGNFFYHNEMNGYSGTVYRCGTSSWEELLFEPLFIINEND